MARLERAELGSDPNSGQFLRTCHQQITDLGSDPNSAQPAISGSEPSSLRYADPTPKSLCIAQCTVPLPGTLSCGALILENPVPAEPRPISSSVASRIASILRFRRKAIP